MGRKEIIFLSISILFLIALFIRGCIIEKSKFQEKASGILLNLEKAGRGSYRFKLFDPELKSVKDHVYENVDKFETLQVQDSIVKDNQSFYLKVYRKKNGVYLFIDSFEVAHW